MDPCLAALHAESAEPSRQKELIKCVVPPSERVERSGGSKVAEIKRSGQNKQRRKEKRETSRNKRERKADREKTKKKKKHNEIIPKLEGE